MARGLLIFPGSGIGRRSLRDGIKERARRYMRPISRWRRVRVRDLHTRSVSSLPRSPYLRLDFLPTEEWRLIRVSGFPDLLPATSRLVSCRAELRSALKLWGFSFPGLPLRVSPVSYCFHPAIGQVSRRRSSCSLLPIPVLFPLFSRPRRVKFIYFNDASCCCPFLMVLPVSVRRGPVRLFVCILVLG